MKKTKPNWIRYRFHANPNDPRPVIWPAAGPYWVSGYGDDYSIVIAYLPPGKKLAKYWPEASDIDEEEAEAITYTSRFPQPDWWKGE